MELLQRDWWNIMSSTNDTSTWWRKKFRRKSSEEENNSQLSWCRRSSKMLNKRTITSDNDFSHENSQNNSGENWTSWQDDNEIFLTGSVPHNHNSSYQCHCCSINSSFDNSNNSKSSPDHHAVICNNDHNNANISCSLSSKLSTMSPSDNSSVTLLSSLLSSSSLFPPRRKLNSNNANAKTPTSAAVQRVGFLFWIVTVLALSTQVTTSN